VGSKRRAEDCVQVGEDPSDPRHKRARCLDDQGSRVERTHVRDQGATLKASTKPQVISQGVELEEEPHKLQEHPSSTPCRLRRPEGPLPGEETGWEAVGEDRSEISKEEGTVDEGETADTNNDESVSGNESSMEDEEESLDDDEESSGKGEESAGEGVESTDDGDESAATQGQGKYCHTCQKRFTRPSDLKRHLKSAQAHGGGSQVCKHCRAILARADGLGRHLQICPAIKAARDGKAYDENAKRRGRPTLLGKVDIPDRRSMAGQASGSGSSTTKAAPRSQRATQPLVGGRSNPPRQCKRV